ncbi:F-actin-uncapping protein LRRC16A-like [Leptodactylus fuscus]|uniref:F-actin-uncapping protein LRRC16A-like n=1 Tax=Leptodactylus fuscus TaxID=238119 RepID=UPI003F4F277B
MINSLSLADSRLKSGTNVILNALRNSNNLTKLDISGNSMGDTGANLLAKCLHINRKLRTLIWDRNNTTFVGFLDVAHALKRNFTLMTMPLPMSDLSQAYRMNSRNTEDALQKIQSYLLRNNQFLNGITGDASIPQEKKLMTRFSRLSEGTCTLEVDPQASHVVQCMELFLVMRGRRWKKSW